MSHTFARLRDSAAGILLVTLLLSHAAHCAEPQVPPLNDPPTGLRLTGKLVWADLVTPDPDAARRFYGELFGWTFTSVGSGKGAYALAHLDGTAIAGIVGRANDAGERSRSRWIPFMSVRDVSATERAVSHAGGKALVATRTIPARGTLALFADPEGAVFGALDSTSGDPGDYLPEAGDWIWAQLLSRDADKAAGFYAGLAGYVQVETESSASSRRLLLTRDGYARASILQIPSGHDDLRPDWLLYVRVADVRKASASAERLGARVLVAVNPELFQGRVAVIADPGGAPVGLLQWEEE
ncbi:MAG TPA: VOC family protein [Burkholderiales bacterium]|nr:VOC family protein [Burkholderiales bacterium]